MKNAYLSYPMHNPETRITVEYLRDHLRMIGIQPVEVEPSLMPHSELQRSLIDEINRCSVFISFLDTSNPNMMFELGYAYAKNKRIIIVCDDFKSIPMDMQNSVFVQRNSPPSKLIHQIESRLEDIQEYDPFHDLDSSNPRKLIQTLATRPDILDSVEPAHFERIIAEWFEYQGCSVDVHQQSRDFGYDFLVTPFRDSKAIVQIKKYKSSSQISISVVRQMVGSMSLEHAEYGVIISSAPFTKSAINFANEIEPNILLWTLEDLSGMEKRGITMR